MGRLFAQESPDTALFRELGVHKMTVYVKLPLLKHKSVNDSCRTEEYKWNDKRQLIYDYQNNQCYGWRGLTENHHEFDPSGKLLKTKQLKDGENLTIRYTHNQHGDLERIVQYNESGSDSFVTHNLYMYDKKSRIAEQRSLNIYHLDTNVVLMKFLYDDAGNVKEITTYGNDGKPVQKQTYDITPKSRKLLEFSTQTYAPKNSFTKGWNYYDFDARLFKTQYSNNTWTEYYYKENGLLDQSHFYNMEGNLSTVKIYVYEF